MSHLSATYNSFGQYVKALREQHQIGLRDFCKQLDFDPSRWSKIERDQLQPPHDEEFLTQIAKLFKMPLHSESWTLLKDLASISRGELPEDIMSDQKILKSLPVFFRTIRGERPTQEELKALLEILRNS